MMEPGGVFICHAPEDAARCAPLVDRLRGWGLAVWFESRELASEERQSPEAQAALTNARVLLRVCTRATRGAYWMSLETGAFLDLQGHDFRAGRAGQRTLINLVLDAGYTHEPFDRTAVLIDAAGQPAQVWVSALRQALGLSPLAETPNITLPPARRARGVSRRGLVGAGIAAVAVIAAGAGGDVLLRQRQNSGPPAAAPLDPRLRWRFKTGDNVLATPLVANGSLYIGSNDQNLFALDATTGNKRWSYFTKAPLTGAPVPHKDSLYLFAVAQVATDASGTAIDATALLVLDPGTGKVSAHKSFSPSNAPMAGPALSGDLTNLGVVTVSGSSVVAGVVTFVQAFDANSGIDRWMYGLPARSHATPIVAGGLVYIGADDGSFNALDGASGALRWSAQTGGRLFGAPAVAGGVVYTGADDGMVYAFDALSGAVRWHYATGGQVATTPAVADGLLYAGSGDGTIFALDAATGAVRWRIVTGGGVFSSPTVANGTVYCGSNDGHLYALDAQSGTLVRRYQTGAAVVSSPVVVNGLVYCGSNDHYVYAFAV